MTHALDAYLRDLDGAVDLLRAAQEADGDDRHQMLDLAADAWIAARDAGGFSFCAVDPLVSEFEIERLAGRGVMPDVYGAMLSVYLQKRLAAVRGALRQLEAME